MKRLAAIIISAFILFSFAACNFLSCPGTTGTDDLPTHANPEHLADFSSYDEIIRTFKAIVNCLSCRKVVICNRISLLKKE